MVPVFVGQTNQIVQTSLISVKHTNVNTKLQTSLSRRFFHKDPLLPQCTMLTKLLQLSLIWSNISMTKGIFRCPIQPRIFKNKLISHFNLTSIVSAPFNAISQISKNSEVLLRNPSTLLIGGRVCDTETYQCFAIYWFPFCNEHR